MIFNSIENIKLHADKYQEILLLLQQLTSCPPIPIERYLNIIYNLHENHEIYIYFYNNKLVGMGTILIERKIIHNGANVAHIEDLVVDKEHRNKGIANLLINFLKQKAKDRMCYKIILDCAEELVPFYEKNSFKKSAIQMRIDI
mgnify:CR=1 FL=1